MYEQIARNKWRSALLVIGVLLLAIGAGYGFGLLFEFGWIGAIIAAALAFFGSIASYRYGDRLVLRASRAKPADEERYARLHNVVEGICIAAGIPKPAVYVIPEQAPNAFATGRNPEHASIAVTEGLLETMNRVELEGVIAHELAHVRNRDILVGMLAATLVGVVVLISDFTFRALFWGGGRGRRGGKSAAPFLLLAFALAILAPLFAQLIRLAVSRRREYLADADGALLTRYPPGLASALRKIGASHQPLKAATNATAHLWLSKPSHTPGKGWTFFERLFSTHPPIEERIRALEDM